MSVPAAPRPFAKLKLEPAYRKVAAALTESITSGALRVGERLPSETELGLRMGVHRSTVREALRELESAGLLRRERGSKLMMVSRPDRDTVASGVTRALTLHEATVAEVEAKMDSISGGMRPKLGACLDAIAGGTRHAHIIDGRRPHSLLLELFTDAGIGTKVTP